MFASSHCEPLHSVSSMLQGLRQMLSGTCCNDRSAHLGCRCKVEGSRSRRPVTWYPDGWGVLRSNISDSCVSSSKSKVPDQWSHWSEVKFTMNGNWSWTRTNGCSIPCAAVRNGVWETACSLQRFFLGKSHRILDLSNSRNGKSEVDYGLIWEWELAFMPKGFEISLLNSQAVIRMLWW